MATYSFQSIAEYDGTGAVQSAFDFMGTLDDGDAGSTTFSDGEDTNGLGEYVGQTDGGLPIVFDGASYFIVSPNNAAGTTFPDTITVPPPNNADLAECFAAGTMIATPEGERAVETLEIGDLVTTAEGKTAPVKWVGRQTFFTLFSGGKLAPVRIKAGALGGGLPHSDLTVTADHGMVLDGMVINAAALINGDSIDFVPADDMDAQMTVYHVETEAHEVILANGAPAETYVDYLGRKAFDNYAEYLELYGAERIIPDMAAPRISSQRMLPESLRTRLGIAAADTGFDAKSA